MIFLPITNKVRHLPESEDEIERYINQAITELKPERLIPILDERASLYKNKSTNHVIRIRGFILSSFKSAGLPEKALPFVLEELENGKHPYIIAGAACALRGSKIPVVQAIPFLFTAINNLGHGDDSVSFYSLKLNNIKQNYTTGLGEIFATFAWYGTYAKSHLKELKELIDTSRVNFSEGIKARIQQAIIDIENDQREVSDCCNISGNENSFRTGTLFKKVKHSTISDLILEDHDGKKIKYKEFFSGKPSIAAFFYTRCDNPNKCSLTITKLGQLQKLIKEQGLENKIKIAAFTYDPGYDVAYRMKAYCENRQMELNEDYRSFRVWEKFEKLQQYFDLGVNYIGTIVNKHTIEVYLIDRDGQPQNAYSRLQWDNKEVLEKITLLIDAKRNFKVKFKDILQNCFSVLLSVLVAFFPKCPMCWAAYMSAFGITGLNIVKFKPWLFPLLICILGINLYVLWRGSKQRNGVIPFYLSIVGISFITIGNLFIQLKPGIIIGLVLIVTSSLLNSLHIRVYNKFRLKISRLF